MWGVVGIQGVNLAHNGYGLYVDSLGSSVLYGPNCGYWQDANGWSDGTG